MHVRKSGVVIHMRKKNLSVNRLHRFGKPLNKMGSKKNLDKYLDLDRELKDVGHENVSKTHQYLEKRHVEEKIKRRFETV